MTKTRTFSSMTALALSLSLSLLAACGQSPTATKTASPAPTQTTAPTPAKTSAPSTVTSPKPSTSTPATTPSSSTSASSQAAEDAALIAQTEQEFQEGGMVADDESGLTTQAVEAEVTTMTTVTAKGPKAGARRASINATLKKIAQTLTPEQKDKIKMKANELRTKAKERVAEVKKMLKGAVEKSVTDNELGGKTILLNFEVTLKNGGTRKHTIERVYNADKVLVTAEESIERTFANGRTMTASRTKALQEDGSYKIHFESTTTLPTGETREIVWDKTITKDGQVTGTGTIKRFNGTTVTKTLSITLTGTEEDEVTTVTDSTSNVSATTEASAEEGADDTTTVTDTSTNTQTTETVNLDEPSTDASASPTPAASVEPSPASSPEASVTPSAEPSSAT